MKIILFAILLPTLLQTIHCEEGLKLRENTSQCWKLKKFDSKTPKTALASLPGKIHIFWEGHKILRNLHQLFVLCTASQIIGGDFAKFPQNIPTSNI